MQVSLPKAPVPGACGGSLSMGSQRLRSNAKELLG